MKKNLFILGIVSFTLCQANSADDRALNNFIGNNTYQSTYTKEKPNKKKDFVVKTVYNKKTKTYFINFDRPNYKEIDVYKNYNKADLKKDYIKQIDVENKKKDTL
jgi:hypothetical protein